MQEYAASLQAASQRYGVPAPVIAAIWGMESNYGSNFGSFSAVDALATLAFDGRRAEWAQKELIAALRIIDNGDIDAAHMISSWAGAMGNTQFLPSVFLQYAVDADGDGRRDIWGSMADVAASTANYLASSGWNPGEPWGVEVRLPANFDYARTELSTRQNSNAWAAEGVQSVNGQALPAMAGASIIAPAGARGPAFMVGSNFRAILRYNNSTNYALAVGLLASQLAGNGGVSAEWPRDLGAFTREQTRALQTALTQRGFATGVADGVMGPATRAGLRQYQQSQGLAADGYPTLELLQRLQAGNQPQKQ
ncbi:Membrane-bound lytic murein transglycosylase B precursor [Comamonas testosteroni]|nr:Membrane-bound lytic murein transglycosylase B precursor [Comamonas testosteroni]